MISVSGIRGIVGAGLSRNRHALRRPFATWLGPGPIVRPRFRPSGPALRHAVPAGLLGAGREVQELGIVPTPTVQLQWSIGTPPAHRP
jgi:phosphomannomutase